MSEYITHTCVTEDCLNISLASDEINATFKEAIERYKSFALLGGIARGGDRFIVKLLSKYREENLVPELEYRIAFILGWLCHRATDREFKPLYRELEPDSSMSPRDISIYYDVFLFKEYYISDQNIRFLTEDKLQNIPLEPSVLELFRLILQRLLIEIHTLKPDMDDAEGWIDKLFKLKQDFYVDIGRYEEILKNPDENKIKRFILDVNFFDHSDPIIKISKRIRKNEYIDPNYVISAIYSDNKSYYARAVQLSYSYILAASKFFQGEIDENELSNRLNIGKMGRDGKVV